MTIPTEDLFAEVLEYPSEEARRRFDRLVGLEETTERLCKEGALLLDRGLLEAWSKRHYRRQVEVVQRFQERSPLFVFAGDVGTGKTELAKTIGDPIARESKLQLHLYSLSLSTRGSGAVGEMTKLISAAFDHVREEAERASKGRRGVVLLVDEADSLAQSRELSQMHHEDRAGVSALIRGVDDIATRALPVLVIMCTNRPSAIDPAVLRRAAAVYEFTRPNKAQRRQLLLDGLRGTNLTEADVDQLAEATGTVNGREVPFTYSDLTNRLLPQLVLDAYPSEPIQPARALERVRAMVPTPKFDGERSA